MIVGKSLAKDSHIIDIIKVINTPGNEWLNNTKLVEYLFESICEKCFVSMDILDIVCSIYRESWKAYTADNSNIVQTTKDLIHSILKSNMMPSVDSSNSFELEDYINYLFM